VIWRGPDSVKPCPLHVLFEIRAQERVAIVGWRPGLHVYAHWLNLCELAGMVECMDRRGMSQVVRRKSVLDTG